MIKTEKTKNPVYSTSGGRKTAIARAHLTNATSEKSLVTINGIKLNQYFPGTTNIKRINDILKPLKVTNTLNQFDVQLNVCGGGKSGQADAASLAIARALVKISEGYKEVLRDETLLTRDARVKERKKYGLKAARKAPQFSKR